MFLDIAAPVGSVNQFIDCSVLILINPRKSWKITEFKIQVFQVWQIVESGLGPGKSWKVKKCLPHFCSVYMFPAFSASEVIRHTRAIQI